MFAESVLLHGIGESKVPFLSVFGLRPTHRVAHLFEASTSWPVPLAFQCHRCCLFGKSHVFCLTQKSISALRQRVGVFMLISTKPSSFSSIAPPWPYST
jgi:hypothetical protein